LERTNVHFLNGSRRCIKAWIISQSTGVSFILSSLIISSYAPLNNRALSIMSKVLFHLVFTSRMGSSVGRIKPWQWRLNFSRLWEKIGYRRCRVSTCGEAPLGRFPQKLRCSSARKCLGNKSIAGQDPA
jgi:hypothetical protein